ncbi:uncharacterized protein LOC125240438 [Leguminivora glycinivorella]|uniref:uncharacterized protein LOC125232014 n=1 Tax=Leguminivora glycinivorella TaxID=1035111 RepID=UPI00200CE39A|nr:uncharacterized protein LOC125232014 [Leguminivora glycinivorella]XP_048004287.1 uncharacterized protein LOC125240438 [Leguminivora glycinivorella]
MKGLTPEQRKRIVDKYVREKGISMRMIAKIEKVSRSAVFNAIKKYGQDLSFKDKPKSGRKIGSHNRNLDSKICRKIKTSPNASIRDVAKKCKTTVGMVQRAKKRNNLRTYRKQRKPKRSQKQAASVKTRLRKLYDTVLTKNEQCIIQDDETYVKLDYSVLPGPQYFTVRKGEQLDEGKTSIYAEKFGSKAMVWQAICECGMKSTAYITTSTMTTDVYIKECLKKRILPLIRRHRGSTLFWPDLASCHYASRTREWMEANGVEYVEKSMNPPNYPEVRPIEEYWAIMKRILRQRFSSADSVKKFKKDWVKAAKTVTVSVVRNLMKNVRVQVRKIARNQK